MENNASKKVVTEERTSRAHLRKRRWQRLANPELLTVFWVISGLLVAYIIWTFEARPLVFTFAGLLVSCFALLPSYLWCKGRAQGLPIWPLSCAGMLLTYGVQLFVPSSHFQDVSNEAIWRAAITVSGYLLIGTLVWLFCVTRPRTRPRVALMIQPYRIASVLLGFLAIGTVYTLCTTAGWLDFLSGGFGTAIRGFIRGPIIFAVFVLASRWGERSLRPRHLILFLILVISYCVADAASLYLISSIATGLMLLVGFAMGRRVIPWAMIIGFVLVVGSMHLGKDEMRKEYWGEDLSERTAVTPWKYPVFYAKWARCSIDAIVNGKPSDEQSTSLLERANTIYLLLQAQDMAPAEVPFLHGATYAIIPGSLVPRIFWEGKVSPHDSTTMLNVHFGNQTWEAAQVTSIGWGMLNEAYANFGYFGVAGLAIVLGAFYGLLARWSIGYPPTSMRTFIGIFTMSFAIQTEMSAAVYISAYLQGGVALWAVVRLFASYHSLQPDRGLVTRPGLPGNSRTRRARNRRRTPDKRTSASASGAGI